MENLFWFYINKFFENCFWNKFWDYVCQVGLKIVYFVLFFFYVYCCKDMFYWVKNIVFGILGYFFLFIDVVFDFMFIIGYIDDIGVFVFGFVIIVVYVNQEVKEKVKGQFYCWFGVYDEDELVEVDVKL